MLSQAQAWAKVQEESVRVRGLIDETLTFYAAEEAQRFCGPKPATEVMTAIRVLDQLWEVVNNGH